MTKAAVRLSLLSLLPLTASAQAVKLSAPNATLKEEFSAIRGVRELRDGRVLVSDYLDQRVVVVDFATGSLLSRVTKGGGPGEARLPTRLVPALGDSTFLVDLGNNRLLLLDGQGRPGRTIPGERPGVLGVRGVDQTGALYFAVPGWAERENALPGDSVRVVRWQPGSNSTELITVIQGERMRSDIREPARVPRIPTVGYAAQDAWVMGTGGVIRIVRAGGYTVESRASKAAPVIGPSYAWSTRPVNAADRAVFVRNFLTTSPMSGKGENGGMGFSPPPTDEEIQAMLRNTQFAERHPMFSAGDVVAAMDGKLWVGRIVEPGKPVLYDVFDPAGRRIASVELQPGRRIAAVGMKGVYVIFESEEGLQHLERYSLPSP